MDILSAIIGILGLAIAGIGAFYTWKTFINTDSIKESVRKEVERDRFYFELPELIDKANECEIRVLSPDKPFNVDYELIVELRYICDRLQKHLSDDDTNAVEVDKIIRGVNCLRDAPSNHPNLQLDYGILVKDIKSILKSGRS